MRTQDIGALAMMEKLRRIWLPEGTPRENIEVSFDREWHKRVHENMIARFLAENSYAFLGKPVEQEAYLRRTYKYKDDSATAHGIGNANVESCTMHSCTLLLSCMSSQRSESQKP